MFLLVLALSRMTFSDIIVPESRFASEKPYSPYSDGPKSDWESSRWSGSLSQFGWGWLGGAAGTALGAAGGAILGDGIGYLAFGNRKEPDEVSPIYRIRSQESASIFGAVIGGMIGDGVGTGLAVHSQADQRYTYPSQGPWFPALAAGGVLTAGVLYSVNMPENPSEAQATISAVLVLIAPQIAAVVTDRLLAPGPANLSLVPWFPSRGQQGLVAISRF